MTAPLRQLARSSLLALACISFGCDARKPMTGASPARGTSAAPALLRAAELGAATLSAAPPGSWAEYTTLNASQQLTLRFALVSREGGLNAVEYGLVRAAGNQAASQAEADVVMRAVFAPHDSVSARPQSLVAQLAGREPMEQRITDESLISLVPATDNAERLNDAEPLQTAAGKFVTQHVRCRAADGSFDEYWLSEAARPVGLVQLLQVSKDGQRTETVLTGMGTGAVSRIVAKARPNDDATFAREMVASVRELAIAQQP